MDKFNLVVPEVHAKTELEARCQTETRFHDALVAGLARVVHKIGRGNLADKSGYGERGLRKVFSGSVPNGQNLIELLIADPTILDEVLALYGLGIHRLPTPEPTSDHATIADTLALAAEHSAAVRDGKRDHRSTLRIADKARPVIAEYSGIVAEADRIRGIRAA